MARWSDHQSQQLSVKERTGRVVQYDLDDFVGVSMGRDNVKKALIEQPAKFAYIATLQAAAMTLSERLEERISLLKAELNVKIRNDAESSDPPLKMTNDAVEAMVKNSKQYRAAVEEHQAAREQEEQLKAIRDAMKQRVECLIALANNFRLELDTDPGSKVGGKHAVREKA